MATSAQKCSRSCRPLFNQNYLHGQNIQPPRVAQLTLRFMFRRTTSNVCIARVKERHMFNSRFARFAALLIVFAPALAAQVPSASEPPRYALPPKEIVDVFDAPLPPRTTVSPSRQVMALESLRPHPTIAELSQPMLRLAGSRINPKTNGPRLAGNVYAIALKRISDGTEVTVAVPRQANVSYVRFSPDGSRLSFINTKENALELWVADTTTGAAQAVSGPDRLNGTSGDPCDWLNDNVTLVCKTVATGRGPAPAEPTVSPGVNVQEDY